MELFKEEVVHHGLEVCINLCMYARTQNTVQTIQSYWNDSCGISAHLSVASKTQVRFRDVAPVSIAYPSHINEWSIVNLVPLHTQLFMKTSRDKRSSSRSKNNIRNIVLECTLWSHGTIALHDRYCAQATFQKNNWKYEIKASLFS